MPVFIAVPKRLDAIVVGAGFAGLYMLYRLRELGLSVKLFEAGSGVGGTWYWNRFPGARCDAPSIEYSYGFSEELQQEWTWSEKYATQPEILSYLEHVADRFDLKKDIVFNTRVKHTHFDESTEQWTIETDQGHRISSRYCIMATGCLSQANLPKIKGIETFKGRAYHSTAWPREQIDFSKDRVGIIGTGSTAVQIIPILAEQAKKLTVFQRTPNYVVPARNEPHDPESMRKIKAGYRDLRHRISNSAFAFALEPNPQKAVDATPEQRKKEFESRWGQGGAAFFLSYNDLLTNERSNKIIGDFVRDKIRSTVKDPKVAEALVPNYIFGCKRVGLGTGYYETFNRPNVELVDVSENPIDEITPQGIVVQGKLHELDVLVYATGFDAMTGALTAIDIRGRGGRSLKDKWADGPKTYLGLSVEGFPNLFTISGPGSPSVLTTMVPSIEQHVDWITECIRYMESHDQSLIETTGEMEDMWSAEVSNQVQNTLLTQCNSWQLGANVPGKKRVYMPYLGFKRYVDKCREVVRNGYEGFVFTPRKKKKKGAA